MATCSDITEHVIRYFCSKCNTALKETAKPITDVMHISEECPTCGKKLSETLLKMPKPSKYQLPVKLQSAYELATKLTFGIPEFDRLLSLSIGDRACIIGSRKHAGLIVTRLCVRALMSRRHGGLAGKVLCIDAGNSINLYQCVSFARQYGMEVKSVLRSIIVSRVFTIYQLAGLVVRKLQLAIQKFTPNVIVISDLLRMFTEEPQQVKHREARYLIQEIMRAIDRLPRNILVIMSLYTPWSRYNRLVLPTFNKRIEIEEKHLGARFYNHGMLSKFSMAGTDLRLASR